MNKRLGKIMEKAGRAFIEATKAYEDAIRLISEAENEYKTMQIPKNDWIPVSERLPENDNNVRVTAVLNNGELATGFGWYNRIYESWRVCLDDDNVFYWNEVVAWKENTDEPYQPEGDVSD